MNGGSTGGAATAEFDCSTGVRLTEAAELTEGTTEVLTEEIGATAGIVEARWCCYQTQTAEEAGLDCWTKSWSMVTRLVKLCSRTVSNGLHENTEF